MASSFPRSVTPSLQVASAPRHAVAARDAAWTPLLNPHQAADFLNVPESTLAVWRCTGRVALPYLKVGGHVRYRQEDIERYLLDRHHAASVPVEAGERSKARKPNLVPLPQAPAYPRYSVMSARIDEYMSTHSYPTCAHCGQPVESIDARIVTAAEASALRLPETSDLHCICAECNVLAVEGRVSGSVR